MIDIKQFAELQNKSKNSFAKQRQLMKKVMAGQTVLCSTCQQPLFLITPEHCAEKSSESISIRCNKGCTDIQLDYV
jgi:hypothetical protein